jgi:phosphoribosylanthranilate isomerase
MRPKIVKVCGITRSEDIRKCQDAGTDALGFIFHPASPRNLSIEQYERLIAEINFKNTCKVAVAVTPDMSRVREFMEAGFDKFQFHFPSGFSLDKIAEWSALVGPANLWLAPRLSTVDKFCLEYLTFAQSILVDAYAIHAYGGTGKQADWERFKRLRVDHPGHQWIFGRGTWAGYFEGCDPPGRARWN